MFLQDAEIDEQICTLFRTLISDIDLAEAIILNTDRLTEPALQAAAKLQESLY